jgi:hypothetical protein
MYRENIVFATNERLNKMADRVMRRTDKDEFFKKTSPSKTFCTRVVMKERDYFFIKIPPVMQHSYITGGTRKVPLLLM